VGAAADEREGSSSGDRREPAGGDVATDPCTEPDLRIGANPSMWTRRVPEWVTVREAAFLARTSEELIRDQVDAGAVAAATLVLEGGTAGGPVLLIRALDLSPAGGATAARDA